MDLIKEIRTLESLGVFIHLSYDHYTDGTNCNWSIEFIKTNNQTMWFGDNHEFGDTVDCLIIAIKFANWLLYDDNLEWYFYNVKETITPEGHAAWVKNNNYRKLAHTLIMNNFKTE